VVRSRRSGSYCLSSTAGRGKAPGNCGFRKQALITCDTESHAWPGLLGVPPPRREKDATDAKPLPVRVSFFLGECKPVLGLGRGSIVVVWPLPARTVSAARQQDAGRWSSW